ncbi:MAG: GspE/PulE family protein [Patescibacteria group bacterium]|nr:GspE/PulE family protein [Patescibacteria group bacterium]
MPEDSQASTTQPGDDSTDLGVKHPEPGYIDKVNRGMKEKAIAERAKSMNMNYVDLSSMPINPDYLHLVPKEEAAKAFLIPFFRIGKKIRLAIAHPTNQDALAIINHLKNEDYQININLASEESIQTAMRFYESEEFSPKDEGFENIIDESQIEAFAQEIEGLQALKNKLASVTAEEALNVINVGAMKTQASDIHYQPEENHVTVRFRIDGILQDIFDLDKNTYQYIANQLKYQAKMKLNVATKPQDGRFYFNFNKRKVDVRVSALPTEYGETFVLRLLDSGEKAMTLSGMGFAGRNLELLEKATKASNGMVLVTGPTGSGKTTTLYAMLRVFNKPEVKIITLEDPIEYHIENVAQSQVNEKRGYTFGAGLRSVLRQDPDVVMIGEIRDSQTAETAAQAALTGHVLLSTLHTNSAVETIPRLTNIGLKPYMIAPAIHTIVAQRLVRVLCKECMARKPITEAERDEISRFTDAPAELSHAVGCTKCSHTGYSGRTVIAEVFAFNDEIRELVLAEKSSMEILEATKKTGMVSLKNDGMKKVAEGVTTLEEVQRVSEETQ